MTVGSMYRAVVANPENRGRRLAQARQAISLQLRGRLLGRPTRVRLGQQSWMWAHVDSWASKAVAYANPPDPEMHVWTRELKPGDLFVDVGANAGAYTLWALDRGAHVIAVEPDPAAVRRLRANLELNGYQAEVVEAALLDRTGVAHLSTGLDTCNHLVEAGLEVAASTLDIVLGERRAAGVKIDVEGFERVVLEGASKALSEQRIGLLQLEWNDLSRSALGESRAPIVELLDRHGYALSGLDGRPLSKVENGADVFARPRPATGAS